MIGWSVAVFQTNRMLDIPTSKGSNLNKQLLYLELLVFLT